MTEIVKSKSGIGRVVRREVYVRRGPIGTFNILDRKTGAVLFHGFSTEADARSWIGTMGSWVEVRESRPFLRPGEKEIRL